MFFVNVVGKLRGWLWWLSGFTLDISQCGNLKNVQISNKIYNNNNNNT
jgi:hypothetical protein